MNTISGVYKITNTITGDFYIGSSKNVKKRLADHKCTSTWSNCPNNPMYLDMKKYGIDKFAFEIIEVVEVKKLKEMEQHFIETLKPSYNSNNAKGLDVEKRKEYQKEYQKSDKGKESHRKASNKYYKSDKGKEHRKEYQKEYQKSNKGKESHRKANNKYNNQLCSYNGETLTLCALAKRFRRRGINHPTIEAKKYLLNKQQQN